MSGKGVIISGSIDMSQNNYAIDVFFEDPFHISSNGIIFEFWAPEISGESFKFYPTLTSPQK